MWNCPGQFKLNNIKIVEKIGQKNKSDEKDWGTRVCKV